MKRFTFSCLLGLALVVGDVRAQMRVQRGQQQATPSPDAQETVVQPPANVEKSQRPQPARQPSSVLVKPSGTLQKPSGVLNTPSGVLNKPSGVLNKPSSVLTSPNATFAQPQQNFVGGQREFRRFRPDGDSHKGDRDGDSRRGDFRHRGHRSNFVVVYVRGAPCWYPFYTAYPYYYYEAPPTVVYDDTNYVPPVDEGAGGGAVQTAPSYGELGRQWGQDLRREIATWDDFVGYVRAYIVVAAPAAQAEFREAFIASYGINGAAAYDKAAEQAAQSSAQGPKIINMQPAY